VLVIISEYQGKIKLAQIKKIYREGIKKFALKHARAFFPSSLEFGIQIAKLQI